MLPPRRHRTSATASLRSRMPSCAQTVFRMSTTPPRTLLPPARAALLSGMTPHSRPVHFFLLLNFPVQQVTPACHFPFLISICSPKWSTTGDAISDGSYVAAAAAPLDFSLLFAAKAPADGTAQTLASKAAGVLNVQERYARAPATRFDPSLSLTSHVLTICINRTRRNSPTAVISRSICAPTASTPTRTAAWTGPLS